MASFDRFGAPLSSSNRASIQRFDRAASLLLGFFSDPLAEIEAALAEDPDFVMGHAFRAGLFAISSEAAAEPELRRTLEKLAVLESSANDRERGHIAALRAWARRDFHGASELYGRVALEHPRDLVALQFAHQTDFLLGQATMLRDRVARTLPAWSEEDSDFGYLLGMLAFGLEECGHYERAEEAGRRAVSLQARDAWAHHAVAHVYEMRGDTGAGIEWLSEGARHWAKGNMFAYHNWWHLALCHLEQKDSARALALYDEAIRPQPSSVAMEMVDASSMLWRLHLSGLDLGNRWEELAETYETLVEDAYYPFNDAHAMMTFVATGRREAAKRLISALERAAGDHSSSARIIRDVGLPVAHAFRAFGEEDYSTAFDLLLDVRKRAAAFGGSNAQRDVLNLTLLEAAIRAGDRAAARGLAHERLFAKPESPFARALLKRAGTAKREQPRVAHSAA